MAKVREACTNPSLAKRMELEFPRYFPNFLLQNQSTLLECQQERGVKRSRREYCMDALLLLLLENPKGIRRKAVNDHIGRRMDDLLRLLKKEGIVEQEWGPPVKKERTSMRGKTAIYRLTPKAVEILSDNPSTPYEHLTTLIRAR